MNLVINCKLKNFVLLFCEHICIDIHETLRSCTEYIKVFVYRVPVSIPIHSQLIFVIDLLSLKFKSFKLLLTELLSPSRPC